MPAEAAEMALHDLQELTTTIQRLSGLLEGAVLAQRASGEVRRLLGVHCGSIAFTEHPGLLVMRGTTGTRTDELRKLKIPRGVGVGGKALMLGRPASVADYELETSASRDFVDLLVHREGIRGITAVPIEYANRTLGVVYSGTRDIGYVGDRGQLLMVEIARSLAPLIAATRECEKRVKEGLLEERQRLEREFHDNLGQLLFGIGASARRVKERAPATAENLVADLEDIETHASRAASCLRDALQALAPSKPKEGLAAVIGLDASRFTNQTGIPAHFVMLGKPFDVSCAVERVLLALTHEGLHNVEKHARASSVVLSLSYGDSQVSFTIQDDGEGLPEDFELHPVPKAGQGWGLPSLHQRVEGLGGRMDLFPNEDGGVTLRATVPAPEDPSDSRRAPR
ncbi:MAG: histidine kinase [Actinomycetota bacterium]